MNEVSLRSANPIAPPVRAPEAPRPTESPRRGAQRADFARVLSTELDAARGVKFSAHARARIESRSLSLTAADERRLQAAVDLASAKGARQSLVMLDEVALIVDIRSRTVITAMDNDGARGTVFTNIDSAIVAQGGDAAA